MSKIKSQINKIPFFPIGVGLAIFRMKKKLPAPWHNEVRFNLQNYGMYLFPIIFVYFKTWVGTSIPLD